jgi:hypothetical protein
LIGSFAGIKSTGEEEFTVCCAGLKGAVTSKRSHLCIIDDAIKSADDIKNRDIRAAMEDNWNSVIVPTMFEGDEPFAWVLDFAMMTFIAAPLPQ